MPLVDRSKRRETSSAVCGWGRWYINNSRSSSGSSSGDSNDGSRSNRWGGGCIKRRNKGGQGTGQDGQIENLGNVIADSSVKQIEAFASDRRRR